MFANRARFVCLPCRVAFKKGHKFGRSWRDVCPRCGGGLIEAGTALAVPKKRDTAGWQALAAVLESGLRFRQMCCGCGPGYRPRTPREVRERTELASRTGMPVRDALECSDPACADVRQRAGRGGFAPPRAVMRPAPARGR